MSGMRECGMTEYCSPFRRIILFFCLFCSPIYIASARLSNFLLCAQVRLPGQKGVRRGQKEETIHPFHFFLISSLEVARAFEPSGAR